MAKKKPGKKHLNKVYKTYAITGGKLERKNRVCPKCSENTFMAKHNDRWHCGKCKYSEFLGKR